MKYPNPKGKHNTPIATFRYKSENKIIKPKMNIMKTRKILDMTVTTADDVILDFGDQVETIDEIVIGMTATIVDGGTPDGEYIMPSGEIWTFVDGVLTEKKFPPDETTKTMRANVFGEKRVYQLKKGKFYSRAKKKISRIPGKPVIGV